MADPDADDPIEAIRVLKARYFRLLDTQDWAGLTHVFADEIVVDVSGDGPRTTTGAAFVERVARRLAGATTVRHGHMPEIQVASADTATGIWAMDDEIWWPEGSPVRHLRGSGHYHETYVRTDGRWRIASMRLTRLRVDVDPAPDAGPPGVRFDHVDAASDAARWAVGEYVRELDARFPGGFDPGDALDAGLDGFAAPAGAFVMAYDGDEPIGCGGVQRHDDETAEIKRMWLHPRWRGRGLGRRQLAELEDAARGLGYRRVVLDTNSTLQEAIAMYERAGYEPIERYNENPYAQRWFAKDLGVAP